MSLHLGKGIENKIIPFFWLLEYLGAKIFHPRGAILPKTTLSSTIIFQVIGIRRNPI